VNKKYLYSFCIVIIVFLFLFVIPFPKEVDFYYYHVWECIQAHKHNMSFCVCSGFWKKSDPSDLENPCVIHPSEDPYTNIAHGSNLGTRVLTYGIIGYLLTDTTVKPPDPSIMERAPSYIDGSLLFDSLFFIFALLIPILMLLLEIGRNQVPKNAED